MGKENPPVEIMSTGQFIADSAPVMDEVVDNGKSVLLTSNGRLMFLIEPLVVEDDSEATTPEE